jgi:hypothetical protein
VKTTAVLAFVLSLAACTGHGSPKDVTPNRSSPSTTVAAPSTTRCFYVRDEATVNGRVVASVTATIPCVHAP